METKRLILREMTMDDLPALCRIFCDAETMAFYPAPFDEEKVRRWICRNEERYRTFGFGLWAVVLKETGEVIGDCGITMQNIGGSILPEVGYHIRKDHWRKGYGKEAAMACRNWAFINTPFLMLYSYMGKENAASSATARAMGMEWVKEYRDDEGIHHVYAITRKRWETIK
ncbi:MAG: GNAT family N-acetyltransferase [Clostridiales bacterium]|nr:GNAT family N-acetyltransferase [Clostridiales bacterium]